MKHFRRFVWAYKLRRVNPWRGRVNAAWFAAGYVRRTWRLPERSFGAVQPAARNKIQIFIGGIPAEEAYRQIEPGATCEVEGCERVARGGSVHSFGNICQDHYGQIEG